MLSPNVGGAAEPTDEADRGRHPGFARREVLAGGPGSFYDALLLVNGVFPHFGRSRLSPRQQREASGVQGPAMRPLVADRRSAKSGQDAFVNGHAESGLLSRPRDPILL